MPRYRVNEFVYGRPALLFELAEELIDGAIAAAESARASRRIRRERARRDANGRRLALRPGPDTPLWNELVRQVQPYLRRRGSKAQLARLLGVPRQRLQACFRAKYACLDAERTLQLVGWLGFFQRGGQLAPLVRPGRLRRAKSGRPAREVPGGL
jgi:hypothetical protein